MPRNVNGVYTLPSGNPVVGGTVITAEWGNTTMSDVGTALTDSLDRDGRGNMRVPLLAVDGTQNAPGFAFISGSGTGFWRESAGLMSVSVQGAKVGSWTMQGLSLSSDKGITLDQGVISMAGPAPLSLSNDSAAIVWRETGEEPPGCVIQRAPASQSLVVRGNAGVSLETNGGTKQLQFDGTNFYPVQDNTYYLGTVTNRWRDVVSHNGYFLNDNQDATRVLGIRRDTAVDQYAPMFTIDNRGTTGALADHRIGGIAWSSYRDVQSPAYFAAIQGANVNYPGQTGRLDFIVTPENGGSGNPQLAGLPATVRMSANYMEYAPKMGSATGNFYEVGFRNAPRKDLSGGWIMTNADTGFVCLLPPSATVYINGDGTVKIGELYTFFGDGSPFTQVIAQLGAYFQRAGSGTVYQTAQIPVNGIASFWMVNSQQCIVRGDVTLL